MTSVKPNPGSKEALDKGCICAVLDNSHGAGRFGDGKKYGWWITVSCPIHGKGKDNE